MFGEQVPGLDYTLRPCSYGVVLDDAGRVAVVVKRGTFPFLPGGGAKPGEDEVATLLREVREELGVEAEVLEELGRARQFFVVPDEANFQAEMTLFRIRLGAPIPGGPAEEDLDLRWLPPEEVIPTFFHRAHAWAVRAALEKPATATGDTHEE